MTTTPPVGRSLAIGHELGLKRDGMPQTFPPPVSRSGLAASRRSATFNMSAPAELFGVAIVQPTSTIRARSSKAVGLHPASFGQILPRVRTTARDDLALRLAVAECPQFADIVL
jgi:hypothetical protein